jgi:hypothetical protein
MKRSVDTVRRASSRSISAARLARCTLWLLVAVSAPAASPAGQPASDPSLPAAVAKGVQAVADQCREVGGTPVTTEAVKRVDLTGDGKDDFVLDVGSVNCDGAASIYGDREKSVTVYAGDGAGGAALAFSDAVFGARIEGTGPAAKLWLTVSGAQCGKKPARDFASESFCERALTWNAKTKTLDYAPVSTVKMVQ